MKNEQPELTPRRQKFNEKHKEFTEIELLKEYIYNQELTYDKLEKIRTNTSNLVWFFIGIPLIIVAFIILLPGFFL